MILPKINTIFRQQSSKYKFREIYIKYNINHYNLKNYKIIKKSSMSVYYKYYKNIINILFFYVTYLYISIVINYDNYIYH
jgi:hypothetical protein